MGTNTILAIAEGPNSFVFAYGFIEKRPRQTQTPLPLYPLPTGNPGSVPDYLEQLVEMSAPAIPISPMLSTCCCFQHRRRGHGP